MVYTALVVDITAVVARIHYSSVVTINRALMLLKSTDSLQTP